MTFQPSRPLPVARRLFLLALTGGAVVPATAQFRVEISGVGLTQLPVAFCAGSSENAAPVPAPRPTTVPWYTTLRP